MIGRRLWCFEKFCFVQIFKILKEAQFVQFFSYSARKFFRVNLKLSLSVDIIRWGAFSLAKCSSFQKRMSKFWYVYFFTRNCFSLLYVLFHMRKPVWASNQATLLVIIHQQSKNVDLSVYRDQKRRLVMPIVWLVYTHRIKTENSKTRAMDMDETRQSRGEGGCLVYFLEWYQYTALRDVVVRKGTSK